MNIAITGGSGFLGRHLIHHLESRGHTLTAWQRPGGRSLPSASVRVISGSLDDADSADQLCQGQDAVVHAGVFTPGERFIGGEGDPVDYFQANVIGSMRLIAAARNAGVQRWVFLSSGAVHQRTLPGGDLDESHPLWPMSIYGAAKASVEAMVHGIGWGAAGKSPFAPCTLRPTSIYGIDHPIESSRWYELIQSIVNGHDVEVEGGGKMVHASEVAAAVECLLTSPPEQVGGETFNCTAGWIARRTVAEMAAKMVGSPSKISGAVPSSGRLMKTNKLRALGFQFDSDRLLRSTVESLVAHATTGGQPRPVLFSHTTTDTTP